MTSRQVQTRLLTGAFLWSFCALAANAASPSLGDIRPRGGQRGNEIEFNFYGARLTDAQEVFYYVPGITTTAMEVVSDNHVKVKATISPDCVLGEIPVRMRTATGITELRSLYVGALPSVDEVEPNSDFAAPQAISMNVTVSGVADSEDVDYFVVEAKSGDRISVEVEGMRLGTTLFDPYIAILDERRFELAAVDDSPLVFQDGCASVLAPADGKYIVMVRESAYAGNGACVYRLHVGNFPRPTATLPAGGPLGGAVDVKFLGDVRGEAVQNFMLPSLAPPKFGLFMTDATGISPSGNPFRLSPFGNALEVEPNNSQAEGTPAGEIPLAFNGVIEAPGDVDYFRFKTPNNMAYDVHCYARRIRSPLDPVVYIEEMGGGAIVANDDAMGPDSYFRFTAAPEKEYALRVFDHLQRGGPDFVYRVEFSPVKPSLVMSIPKVSLFSQERQTIVVPRGNRYATLMAVQRNDFGGEVAVSATGLPPGVTLASDKFAPSVSAIPVLFEAPADAPVGGALVDLRGSSANPDAPAEGGFSHYCEITTGGPGQSVYWSATVDRLAVAVAEEAPYTIEIVEPKVPLVQNGQMNLKVVATRKEGFTAPINLQMLFNPPGVGSASGITIPEGQTEAYYPLNANGGAEVRSWKICILGSAPWNGGAAWCSTQLAKLDVEAPFIALQMQRASTEQGKPTDLFCQFEQLREFEGAAKVNVIGLPNKVTTNELEITKETKELIFPLTVDAASPAGKHQNIFCQIVIMKDGEPIVHNIGGTELQIDVPLPPPADAPPPPPMPEPMPMPMPEAPKEKPLTRLEKLRKEAEERKKNGGAPQPQQN